MQKLIETQLVPYDLNMQVIEDLRKKYLDMTIPEGDKAAYEMVMGGLRQCRDIRLACKEWHQKRKKDIVTAGKHYDSEKNRVYGLIGPIESHLKAVRKMEDDRAEEERQGKIAAEKARVTKIEQAIEDINRLGMSLVGLKSDQLQALLDEAMAHDIDEKTYGEFIDTARRTQENVMQAVSEALIAQKQVEEEDRARQEENERLERIRKKQETKEADLKAEENRIEEEKRQAKIQIELARTTRLKAIGLILEGDFFLHSMVFDFPDTIGIIEKADDLFQMSDTEFEAFIEETTPKIEELKRREEEEKHTREEQEAAEKKQREKEAKVRTEKLKPDKIKMAEYIQFIREIPEPELSTEEAQKLMRNLQEGLDCLLTEHENEIKEL